MAVNNFSSWLCQKVSKIEAEVSRLNSRSKIMIVLLGHSMGGIVGNGFFFKKKKKLTPKKHSCGDNIEICRTRAYK